MHQSAEKIESFAIFYSDTKSKQPGFYCQAGDTKNGKNAF
jgi:hypothetical protein